MLQWEKIVIAAASIPGLLTMPTEEVQRSRPGLP